MFLCDTSQCLKLNSIEKCLKFILEHFQYLRCDTEIMKISHEVFPWLDSTYFNS